MSIKWFLGLFLLLGLVSHVAGQELMLGRSSYSFRLGVLDCNNLDALKGCRHEIGHKMDDDLGHPSQSPEFMIAVKAYTIVELNSGQVPSDMAMLIHFYPDQTPVELYAAIYARADGDIWLIPESLRMFYSNDPKYTQLYDCLSERDQVNVCDGLNFSYLNP